jgi:gamma-glutamylcyclotransferase (GGCT)/AIG2-like uncharacterized protein YtfP
MSHKHKYPVKVFVYGTLRKGQRLDYYMDGSIYEGLYYTEGQLMKSEIGNAYIDFDQKATATMGELYYMTYYGLLRINHLESTSGEFPKAYDLEIIPVWKYNNDKSNFDKNQCTYAFVYKMRSEPQKISSGDWSLQINPIEEIQKFMKTCGENETDPEKLIDHLLKIIRK